MADMTTFEMRENKTMTEQQVRYRLKKIGFGLRKSRVRSINLDDLGDYMVFEYDTNGVVIGSRFNRTLDDIIEHFDLAGLNT
jgi:hypothetical protein